MYIYIYIYIHIHIGLPHPQLVAVTLQEQLRDLLGCPRLITRLRERGEPTCWGEERTDNGDSPPGVAMGGWRQWWRCRGRAAVSCRGEQGQDKKRGLQIWKTHACFYSTSLAPGFPSRCHCLHFSRVWSRRMGRLYLYHKVLPRARDGTASVERLGNRRPRDGLRLLPVRQPGPGEVAVASR